MDLVQPEHALVIFDVDDGKIERGIPHRKRLHPDPQNVPLNVNPATTIWRVVAITPTTM
jgi:hypothetical protein